MVINRNNEKYSKYQRTKCSVPSPVILYIFERTADQLHRMSRPRFSRDATRGSNKGVTKREMRPGTADKTGVFVATNAILNFF